MRGLSLALVAILAGPAGAQTPAPEAAEGAAASAVDERGEAQRAGPERAEAEDDAGDRRGAGRDRRRDNVFHPRPEAESPGSLMGGALALGPGFLLHGLGHLYIGETRTAWQLMLTEVAGIALVVAGLLLDDAAQQSGAAGGLREGLLHVGSVLFVSTWLADVLGAFKGASALDPDSTHTEGSRLGLAYRYTDDPVSPFRHHLVLRLDLDTGWVYVRPMVDLEDSLRLRQFQLDLGSRVFRGRNPQNRVMVGARLRRLENAAFGYTAMGLMGYVDGRTDVGQWFPNLRNVYLFGRLGYGYDGLSFADRTGQVPGLFADADFYDTYLVIQSGVGFNLGRLTHLELGLVKDPTRDLRPFAGPEGGLFELGLTHRQSDNLDIEFVGSVGDAFGVWLGLGFGL